MRILILLLLLLFLLGCTAQTDKEFNVSLLNASHEDVFLSEQNKTLEKISFIIKNNELFDLDCDIILSMSNGSNSSIQKGVVGFLPKNTLKNVSLTFEMLYGKTNLSIIPNCKKLDT